MPKIVKKVLSPKNNKANSKNEKLRRRRGQAKCDFIIEYDDSEFVGKTNDEEEEFTLERTQSETVTNLRQSLLMLQDPMSKSLVKERGG